MTCQVPSASPPNARQRKYERESKRESKREREKKYRGNVGLIQVEKRNTTINLFITAKYQMTRGCLAFHTKKWPDCYFGQDSSCCQTSNTSNQTENQKQTNVLKLI